MSETDPRGKGDMSAESETPGQEAAAQEDTAQGTPAPDAAPASKPPGRMPRVRRMARSRGGIAVIGVLVGALLGTGIMAWRSDELPFTAGDMCWDSLSPEVAGALFLDTDVRSRELPLRRATQDRMRTECSMQGFGADELESEVSASVRTLGGPGLSRAVDWTREYLSSRMTPLGGEITGMASSTRAWAALPASCADRSYDPGEKPPLRVVTLASDEPAIPSGQNEVDARRNLDAMSRAVVRLTNGVMEKYGCEGRYADPPKLPRAPEGNEVREDLDFDRLCGLQGVRLPRWARTEEASAERTTPGTRPDTPSTGGVRACDVGHSFSMDRLRLTTVADPELAHVVLKALGKERVAFGDDGQGIHEVGRSIVFTSSCQTGPVAFLAYEPVKGRGKHENEPLRNTVLPAYVKAEAKRLGCGEVNVKLPHLPS